MTFLPRAETQRTEKKLRIITYSQIYVSQWGVLQLSVLSVVSVANHTFGNINVRREI